MPYGDIKLIALDLDGALTDSDKKVSERNYRALMAAQERGITLALATGRSVHGTAWIADLLELKRYGGYMLCYNGALVWDCKHQCDVYAKKISLELLRELYEASKEYGVTIQTYIGDRLYTEDVDNPYVKKAAKINGLTITKTQSFADEIMHPVPKCLMPDEPEKLAKILEAMRERFAGKANIFLSESCFMEIVPWGTDKGEALRALSQHMRLKTEQIMAFGDGNNDIPMIRTAGCGVAMANAIEEVKTAAVFVTETNDDDGVAVIVEQLLER